MDTVLAPELVTKWAYERGREGSDHNAPRMDGEPEELRDVVRSAQGLAGIPAGVDDEI